MCFICVCADGKGLSCHSFSTSAPTATRFSFYRPSQFHSSILTNINNIKRSFSLIISLIQFDLRLVGRWHQHYFLCSLSLSLCWHFVLTSTFGTDLLEWEVMVGLPILVFGHQPLIPHPNTLIWLTCCCWENNTIT